MTKENKVEKGQILMLEKERVGIPGNEEQTEEVYKKLYLHEDGMIKKIDMDDIASITMEASYYTLTLTLSSDPNSSSDPN